MFNLPKYGDGLCLARLAALLERLAIDRDRLQRSAVVVTGSNGKGSTAAFCASIGTAIGLCTGLFTSPHLFRFNERFQIDGEPIADAALLALVARVEAAIAELSQRRGETFGAFEAQFALACLYFQEAGCGLTVFEAGIGGRYDPVRLVGALVTAVTSVDFEHVALLGHSLELIASDKSDACAAGGTIVYGENCRGLGAHLAEYNRHRGISSLYVGDQICLSNEGDAGGGQRFDLAVEGLELRSLEIQLAGRFQLNNAAIAVALFGLWLRRLKPDVPFAIEAAVRSGLRQTRWPGRLDMIRQNPLTVIDVGHTPDGIRQALAGLFAAHGTDGWILVLGVSRDKNAAEIVAALAPAFDVIVCTAAHQKGADAEAIAEAARAANQQATVHVAPIIADAVPMATTMAASQDKKIYVAGGLFLAIEFATVLRGGRAEELDFF